MRKLFSKVLISSLILLVAGACSNQDKFKDTPYLEYQSYRFITDSDTLANRNSIELTVYFTDGDGDLGSENTPTDSCDTTVFNYFVDYFEKVNGTYIEIQPRTPCLPFDSQIPDITPEGSNPTLEGEIISQFEYSGYPANPEADSIRFEFLAVDRAGNRSNISVSPAIPVPR